MVLLPSLFQKQKIFIQIFKNFETNMRPKINNHDFLNLVIMETFHKILLMSMVNSSSIQILPHLEQKNQKHSCRCDFSFVITRKVKTSNSPFQLHLQYFLIFLDLYYADLRKKRSKKIFFLEKKFNRPIFFWRKFFV